MPHGFDEALFGELNGWRIGAATGTPVKFGVPGLTEDQLSQIESKWSFRFPADLRYLLTRMRDEQGYLMDWIGAKDDVVAASLRWPLEGLEFDIEHNQLWLARWGEKPERLSDQLEVLREDFLTWPKLIPIYGHRYMPAEPPEVGNPVFSVYQSDIIYYGYDLIAYLRHEFGPGSGPLSYAEATNPSRIKRIPIWSDFVEVAPGL